MESVLSCSADSARIAYSVARPVNNFGDLLGPVIVRRMLKRLGLDAQPKISARLLSVGSCLHFARDGMLSGDPG